MVFRDHSGFSILMPELPEVETIRRGLAPVFEGGRILDVWVRRKDLRRPFPLDFDKRLCGRGVLAVLRRGKYLLAHLEGEESLVMHLGMSGTFRIENHDLAAFHHPRGHSAHDHVIFHFEQGAEVIYNDPRRFGFMDLVATPKLLTYPSLAHLGIEPLGEDFTPEALQATFASVHAPLKTALLDQRYIAGLGNIYVCEILHRACLSPFRPAQSVNKTEMGRLRQATVKVLCAALEAGGSTLRDHRHVDGRLGYFQHHFAVYDRAGAACSHKGCAGMITRIVQGGRSTYFCAQCQI